MYVYTIAHLFGNLTSVVNVVAQLRNNRRIVNRYQRYQIKHLNLFKLFNIYVYQL